MMESTAPARAFKRAGTARHEGAFLIPPSHATFLTRINSTPNKDGVRRLALQELARRLEGAIHEEAFVPPPTAEEEAKAWAWTLARTEHFANTRSDVVKANRLAAGKLVELLMARVYQLRNVRTLAMLQAPMVETRQERVNRASAAMQARHREQLRPGPRALTQTTRLPSRMSRHQSAEAWHAALQRTLQARGTMREPATGRSTSNSPARR